MKKEITVLCYYASVSGKNGYATAFSFYHYLSQMYMVNVVVPYICPINFFTIEPEHLNSSLRLFKIGARINKDDVDNHFDLMEKLCQNEFLIQKINSISKESDIIICDSVFYVSNAKKYFDKPIIFRSLDVEYDKALYCRDVMQQDIRHIDNCFEYEKKACNDADVILGLTERDNNRMRELYNVSADKFRILPICCGNDNEFICFAPKKRSSTSTLRCLILSSTQLESQSEYLRIMNRLSYVEFHFVGRICSYLTEHPANVILHGVVDDITMKQIILDCDFALNINTMEYGMNVKNMDYFLYGLPVVANNLGVRGYNAKEYIHYYPTQLLTLEQDLEKFVSLSCDERYLLALNAFKLITETYSYANFFDEVRDLFPTYDCKMKFYIFGAGRNGELALLFLNKNGHTCGGFADNNCQLYGTNKYGKIVISPQSVFDILRSEKNTKILIAVNEKFFPDVFRQTIENVDKNQILIYEPLSDNLLNIFDYDTDM